MNNKDNFEKNLDFLEKSFSPVKNNRPSADELRRIKEYSDENLNLILKMINTTNEEEKRNIIVNLIAALDYYIHEIIIWGIVQITLNGFSQTDQYKKIEISIEYFKEFKEKDIFDDPKLKIAIIEKLRKNSYQKWKDIKEGLKLFLPKEFSDKIGALTTKQDNRKALFQVSYLEKINTTRNLIVHHFDREYTKNSQRNDFSIDCKASFDLIKLIIEFYS